MQNNRIDYFPIYRQSLTMFKCLPCSSKILPGEYRDIAENLFPSGGFPDGTEPLLEAAKAFAGVLGIGDDFRQLLDTFTSGRNTGKSLAHFQNNLDLLIQKTWVEKAEEGRKESLVDDVPSLIGCIERGDYQQALEEFGAILEELAYLFFGSQSQKDDFAEYALRIDTQIGLFWWYGGQIKSAPWVKHMDQSALQALLLLGICYLTNF